jgi:hypothetical protein
VDTRASPSKQAVEFPCQTITRHRDGVSPRRG